MNFFRGIMVLMVAWLPFKGMAQYNLEEFGVELGPGFALLLDGPDKAMGPAVNANAFFSHYACGKGYGFHLNAGVTSMFPSTADGAAMTDLPAAEKLQFSFVGLDVAALGKLRIHEYHRPREWAVFFGPRLQVPLMARYSNSDGSGSLDDITEKVSRVWPGVELSVQIRRPIGKKKSWFIHPGAAYFFVPAFKGQATIGPKPLYLFLNFGYALWDQRG
jgi:hypothetical protein